MLKFTVTGDNRTLIGIGLSVENWKRLLQKQPILVKLEDMGVSTPTPIDVLILGGATEAELMQQSDELGFKMAEDTKVHVDPKLKN